MTYHFMTLNDGTEIVHSEMMDDVRVKVSIAPPPDEKLCFKRASCWLPQQEWTDIYGYTEEELDYLKEFVDSEKHLILEFSQTGGFDNASGF